MPSFSSVENYSLRLLANCLSRVLINLDSYQKQNDFHRNTDVKVLVEGSVLRDLCYIKHRGRTYFLILKPSPYLLPRTFQNKTNRKAHKDENTSTKPDVIWNNMKYYVLMFFTVYKSFLQFFYWKPLQTFQIEYCARYNTLLGCEKEIVFLKAFNTLPLHLNFSSWCL